MQLVRRARLASTCPFCHDEVRAGPECPRCEARYHRACADDLGRCAALACEGRIGPSSAASAPVPAVPRARWPWMRVAFITAGLAAVVFALTLGPCESPKLGREAQAIGLLRKLAALEREGGLGGPRRGDVGDLVAGWTRDGYRYDLVTAPDGLWALRARPIEPGVSGDRSFAVGRDGEVWHRPGGDFPLERFDAWPADAWRVGR